MVHNAHKRTDWPTIRKRLEPILVKITERRLKVEKHDLIIARQVRVKELFETFRAPTPDDVWRNLPEISSVLLYKRFVGMAYAPLDEPQVINEIQSFISSWPPKSVHELTTICDFVHIPSHRSAPWSDSSIDYVSSVFSCAICSEDVGRLSQGRCLIGWSAAMAHRRCNNLLPQFTFSERGYLAATTILDIHGLEAHTSGDELDALDCSLACSHCQNGQRLSWRECVRFQFLSFVQISVLNCFCTDFPLYRDGAR